MTENTEWDMPNITEEEYKKIINDLKYQRHYGRWPVADPELRKMPVAEYFHIAWTQYAKILDDGKGLDTILVIQKQINSEIEDVQKNLDDFPDDAEKVYEYRLMRSQNLLNMRATVLKKLITAYSVHGEIESTPDFELNTIQKIALNIVCKGKRKPNKRKILEEYMQIHEADPGKSVKDIFTELEFDYDISYSTFAGWIKKLNEEIESITLSQ